MPLLIKTYDTADKMESGQTMESFIFCHLSEQLVWETPMKDMYSILRHIGAEFNLDGDMTAIYDKLIELVNNN